MIKNIRFLFLVILNIPVFAQIKMRPVEQLIDKANTAWPFVKQQIDSGKNKIEVLAADSNTAKLALYQTQITTRSPLGAVIINTGGILVDDGWIRILGSGNVKLKRSLPEWNKGKSFFIFGEIPTYILIADDAVGGFFALNGTEFGKDKGNIYYLSPDRLIWEPLGFSYTEFLYFCFNNNLDDFYKDLRWKNWRKQVTKLSGNSVFNFFPFLWTKEGKEINKTRRKIIAVQSQFEFNMKSRKELGLEIKNVQ